MTELSHQQNQEPRQRLNPEIKRIKKSLEDYSVAGKLRIYEYIQDQPTSLAELEADFLSRLHLGLPNIEFILGPPAGGKSTAEKEIEHARQSPPNDSNIYGENLIHGEVINQLGLGMQIGGLEEDDKRLIEQAQNLLLDNFIHEPVVPGQIIQIQMPAGVSLTNLHPAKQEAVPEHRGEKLLAEIAAFEEKDVNAIFIGIVPTASVRYRSKRLREDLKTVIDQQASDPSKIREVFVAMGWDEQTLPFADSEEGRQELISMATHCANPLGLKAVYFELAQLALALYEQDDLHLPHNRSLDRTTVEEIMSYFLPDQEPQPNDDDPGLHIIAMTLEHVLRVRFGIKPDKRIILVNDAVKKIKYPNDQIHQKKSKKK
jgi:hypothetical protein